MSGVLGVLLVRMSSSPEGGDGSRAGSPLTEVASAVRGPPNPGSGEEDAGAAAWQEAVMSLGGAGKCPKRDEWPPREGMEGGAADVPTGTAATAV